jgi:hypothetical protein
VTQLKRHISSKSALGLWTLKPVRERPVMSLENVAGFAHAECLSHIDSLIASLGLTYTDRVWVVASLNRRAELQPS